MDYLRTQCHAKEEERKRNEVEDLLYRQDNLMHQLSTIQNRISYLNAPQETKLIDVAKMEMMPKYPIDFLEFCKQHKLRPPGLHSGRGMALLAMLSNPGYHFDRKSCDEFCSKFNIRTNDSIQLFNKHEQWGLEMPSGTGKYYVKRPFKLSGKVQMRKDFKWDGSNESKFIEIERVKKHIMSNYVNVPNELWELGHKNPETFDNTMDNLVLQPPIQGRYRDSYIFLDTLTKIPTPKKLIALYEQGKSPYTDKQLRELVKYFYPLYS